MNTKIKDLLMYIFSSIVIMGEIFFVGFALYIWLMGAKIADANVINLVFSLAMGYHSGFMIVLGYHFGSSKGSSDKNDLLANKDERTKSTTESKTISEVIPKAE